MDNKNFHFTASLHNCLFAATAKLFIHAFIIKFLYFHFKAKNDTQYTLMILISRQKRDIHNWMNNFISDDSEMIKCTLEGSPPQQEVKLKFCLIIFANKKICILDFSIFSFEKLNCCYFWITVSWCWCVMYVCMYARRLIKSK